MPQQMNDHDLLVRIDARTEALQEVVAEMKDALTAKADAAWVTRIEARQEKTELRVSSNERKLNYLAGGLIAVEAALRLLGH